MAEPLTAREFFTALPQVLTDPYIPEIHGDLDDMTADEWNADEWNAAFPICGAPLARGGECPLPARHPGPCDPVGLNPTGRPRRSSAGSRRRHAKRAGGEG